jgi:hypothetical protein
MLMTKERRPAFRTIEGLARAVLLDAGAIREWEEHDWMRARADPQLPASMPSSPPNRTRRSVFRRTRPLRQ